MASTISDLLFSPVKLSPLLNVVHPRPVSWHEVVDAFRKELKQSLPMVSLSDWLDKLDAMSHDASPELLEKIVSRIYLVERVI